MPRIGFPAAARKEVPRLNVLQSRTATNRRGPGEGARQRLRAKGCARGETSLPTWVIGLGEFIGARVVDRVSTACLLRSERLLDLMLAQKPIESRSRDTENPRSPSLLSARGGEDSEDVILFGAIQRREPRSRGGAGLLDVHSQMLGPEHVPAREDDCSSERVLQLADVSRPIVREKDVHRLTGD